MAVVAASEIGIDYPSKLSNKFLDASLGNTIYLHAMHSVVDWFAFCVWKNGQIIRSLSLSPDSGILENIGETLAVEKPYWQGDHPAIDPADMDEDVDPYPFAFHPLELAEEVLEELFGYKLEGYMRQENVKPEEIVLMRFKRSKKKWWRFW